MPAIIWRISISILILVLSWSSGRSMFQSSGVTITPLGPNLALIRFVAQDPNHPLVLYAGGNLGDFYKSTDAGATWNPIGASIPNGGLYSAVVDPTNSNAVYLATDNGLFKSTDAGANWSLTTTSGTNPPASIVKFDPQDPTTIYIGGFSQGIFKSTNGGATWTALNSGIPQSTAIKSFAIDPGNSNIIYASAGSSGVFKSTNGGASWTASSAGLTNLILGSIAIDPMNTSTIYSSASFTGPLKSTDAGASWTVIANGLPTNASTALVPVIDPTNSKILYAIGGVGFYKSTDGGTTWVPLNVSLPNAAVLDIELNRADPRSLYVGTDHGVFFIQQPVDKTPPAVSISSPTTGSFVNSRMVLVEGKAIDDASGTGVASVSVNGSPASYDSGSGNFTATVPEPSDGPFTISVTATDNANNTSLPVVSNFTVDTVPPSVTIDSPIEGASITNSAITVTGNVSDVGSGVALVTVNNVNATIAGGVYTATLDATCNNGQVTLTVIAQDNAFNITTVTRQINVTSTFGGSICVINSGPNGGLIQALAVDPSTPGTLFAATPAQIYKSTNGGANWTPSLFGLPSANTSPAPNINTLVVGPTGLVYAGLSHFGVYISGNGGQSFNPFNNGIQGASSILSLAVDPADPSVVYAGSENNIYKSVDSGLNWTAVANNLVLMNVRGLAIDPTNHTVYAGAVGELFKSTDGGAHWTQVPFSELFLTINCIAIDPQNPNNLYLGIDNRGVFKTTDAGATWNEIDSTLPAQTSVKAVVVSPSNSATLYITTGTGIYKSTDGGSNWKTANTGLPGGAALALVIDPFNANTLYCGAGSGLFKSIDAALNWNFSNTGISNTSVRSIVINPVNPNVVYAGTGFGVYKSLNGGTIWQLVNFGLTNLNVAALAIDPNNTNTLYAGTTGGMFKTTNAGASWTAINSGLASPFFSSVQITGLVVDSTNTNTIYASANAGVFKSTNAGSSWTAVNTGLPVGAGLPNNLMLAIAIDPTNSNTLYVGINNNGVYKTTNGGTSWSAKKAGLSNTTINALIVNPSTPNVVYAGSNFSGFFETADGGDTWITVNTGLPSIVNTLVLNPGDSNAVFAGTPTGVYKLVGNSWHLTAPALSRTAINTLAISPQKPNVLFAGSEGSGVFIIQVFPDTIPPTVSILLPQDGSATSSRKIAVVGSAFDDPNGSGVDKVFVNGSAANYDSNAGRFTSVVTAANDGPFVVSVTAKDLAGNVSQPVTSTVTIDTVPPVLTIDSPIDGATITSNTVTVSGTVSDAGSGVATVTVNGVNAVLNGNTYSASLAFQCNKALTITAAAQDTAGNVTVLTRNVSVQASPAPACWNNLGPQGGVINTVAIDPTNSSTVYAGTQSGIFKSTNGGSIWLPFNNGLSRFSNDVNRNVATIAIDHTNTNTIYIGTDAGIYKTTTGGSYWIFVPVGFGGPAPSVIIDPTDSTILYAAFRDEGVFKSIDSGANWFSVGFGMPFMFVPPFGPGPGLGPPIFSFAIDPSNPSTVYAATANGLYKSTDGGSTGTLVNPNAITALAINPSSPNTIYGAATLNGVLKSTDGGLNWATINNGLTGNPLIAFTVAVSPSTPSVVYTSTPDGIFKSTNSGQNWTIASSGIPQGVAANFIAIDPTDSGLIYVATDSGLFKSSNGGTSWNSANVGINNTAINALLVDPVNPNNIYAGLPFSGGIRKTTDGGTSWTTINNGLPVGNPILVFADDPGNPGTIYAGLQSGGIFRTTNGGATWVALNNNLPDFLTVRAIAVNPQDSNTVYAVTSNGLLKTSDGGTNWTIIGAGSIGDVEAIAIDPSNTATIYAGSFFEGVVYKSIDAGANWELLTFLANSSFVTTILVDPSNPSTIYAGSQDAVFKTTDGGINWTSIFSGDRNNGITHLMIDPSVSATLYVSRQRDVSKSTDGGANWQPIVFGLNNNQINTLAIDPGNTNKIYSGTTDGVYLLNQGASLPDPGITTLNPGIVLPGSPAFSLVVDGGDFRQGSTVQWNGSARPTTFVSSLRLTAAIGANDVAQKSQVTVTVANQSPAGQSNPVTFTVGCGFVLNPAGTSMDTSGGDGTFAVSAHDGCMWTAMTNVPWIRITSNPVGSGNGSVAYTVRATNSSRPRTGTITVGDASFVVTQAGLSCSYSLDFHSGSFTAPGGNGSFVIETNAIDCGWTATSNADWIKIDSKSDTGTQVFFYSVDPNTGPARTSTITIADQTFTVNQAMGCAFTLGNGSQQFPDSGGNGSVNVTTVSGCAWTARTSSSFVHITSGPSGTGSGTVSFTVDQNFTGPRTDTITIAGQTFVVKQDGVKCFIPVGARRHAFDPTGGDGTVPFDLSPDCSYSATTTSAFLTLTSGTTGSGSGIVGFTIDANADGDPRAAEITLKAQAGNSAFTLTVIITELGTSHVLYGDVNGDNIVNVSDLALLANFLAGNTKLPNMQAADVLFDHQINVLDLLTLANELAGNLDLPVVVPNPAPPVPVLEWRYVSLRRPFEQYEGAFDKAALQSATRQYQLR